MIFGIKTKKDIINEKVELINRQREEIREMSLKIDELESLCDALEHQKNILLLEKKEKSHKKIERRRITFVESVFDTRYDEGYAKFMKKRMKRELFDSLEDDLFYFTRHEELENARIVYVAEMEVVKNERGQ